MSPSFARASARDQGSTALNLVYQAAEIFSAIEDRARETEARAQSLCKSAAEGPKFAEKRVEVAERDRRETIDEADRKLQDASRALKQAETRITVAEDYAAAAEFRAQAAGVAFGVPDEQQGRPVPMSLFDDGSVEIICPLCGCTSPSTAAWMRFNDSHTCPACNSVNNLDEDKRLAGLDEPTIGWRRPLSI